MSRHALLWTSTSPIRAVDVHNNERNSGDTCVSKGDDSPLLARCYQSHGHGHELKPLRTYIGWPVSSSSSAADRVFPGLLWALASPSVVPAARGPFPWRWS